MTKLPGKTIEFGERRIIFNEGDPGVDLFFVKSGTVEIYKNHKGREISLAILKQGEIFGTVACLTQRQRSASARSLTDVALVQIPGEKFEEAIKKIPHWLHILINDLISRLAEMNDRYAESVSESTDLPL